MKWSRRSLLRSAWVLPIYGLSASVQAAGSDGERRWPDERTVGALIFHANFDLAEHQQLVGETARLQEDLGRALQLGAAREPIHLFLFELQQTYQRYLQYYFPHVPYRRALFVKRRGPGMVFAHLNPEFEIDVRHETTHAMLHANLSRLPLWLDEGLAEYFEVPADQRATENPHLSALYTDLKAGSLAGIQSLEGIQSLSQMGPRQYRDAWSWVHFMLHGPSQAHHELLTYLRGLQAAAPGERLSRRLQRRLPNLQRRYELHLQNWIQHV